MERYLPLLQTTSLFAGLGTEALLALLRELGAAQRCFGRGETLLYAGQPNRRIGVVLSGQIEALRPAPGGAMVPITHMDEGGVFGDVLSGSSMSSPVTVVTREGCEVLLIPYDRLLDLREDSSPAQVRAVQNLVRTISDKYFMLSRRVDLLVLKTLRAKVCAYLLSEAERAGSQTFTIPYSRMQLADYLNCDRSALSRELSQMQRERLLDTYRSSFKLLQPEALRREVQ
jgi:CRP-like cAMP-binding protein